MASLLPTGSRRKRVGTAAVFSAYSASILTWVAKICGKRLSISHSAVGLNRLRTQALQDPDREPLRSFDFGAPRSAGIGRSPSGLG